MLYRCISENTVIESSCAPEFTRSCELMVAGLGTAGSIAVITGARLGLDTIGIEALGSMGGLGNATATAFKN